MLYYSYYYSYKCNSFFTQYLNKKVQYFILGYYQLTVLKNSVFNLYQLISSIFLGKENVESTSTFINVNGDLNWKKKFSFIVYIKCFLKLKK